MQSPATENAAAACVIKHIIISRVRTGGHKSRRRRCIRLLKTNKNATCPSTDRTPRRLVSADEVAGSPPAYIIFPRAKFQFEQGPPPYPRTVRQAPEFRFICSFGVDNICTLWTFSGFKKNKNFDPTMSCACFLCVSDRPSFVYWRNLVLFRYKNVNINKLMK